MKKILFASAVFFLLCCSAAFGEDVGKWKRFVVTLPDATWSGNPFDVELTGTFVHAATSTSVTQMGFYAGANTWKIFFMPDQLGAWTYTTSSPDSDLNGASGSLTCVASTLPGKLLPVSKRWRLSDSGKFDNPILLPVREWFKSTATASGVGDFITWADQTAGARIIGTTLVYFSHVQDAIPYVIGQEGVTFNTAMWDRLNDHYDAIRDAGMGHYIMFFSDDTESPSANGIAAQSEAEIRLFKYAVARLACYPMVIWDTGIDVSEYRTNAWVDWFVGWFLTNDPWAHPVSSRAGGGTTVYDPPAGVHHSDGSSTIPTFADFVTTWSGRSKPTIMTDRWREYYVTRGNFTRAQIRRGVWEMAIVGGTAAYVSGNENSGYLGPTYASDFTAAPDCGHAARFFRDRVRNMGALVPQAGLVVSGNAIALAANPGEEYVVYYPFGGSGTFDLSSIAGNAAYAWYNPTTGVYQAQGTVSSGAAVALSAPDSNDWVLHIYKAESPGSMSLMGGSTMHAGGAGTCSIVVRPAP